MAKLPLLLRGDFGMELYAAQGFEADDVIASVADQCLGTGARVVVCSNDKDLLSLAHAGQGGSGTYILHADSGSYHALGPAEVQARMGVPPHRVALFKAVAGDSGDNIPGGIKLGPVAAKRLANTYSSVSSVFKNLEHLQKSDRRGLETSGLDHMLLMEKLTTLRYDAPMKRIGGG